MTEHARICEAYLAMWQEVRYRPAAPSDGYGNIELTHDELNDPRRLELEASKYADRFISEENNDCLFYVGISNWTTNRALVYTVEAARLLCCGDVDNLAVKLLQMAIREIGRGQIPPFRPVPWGWPKTSGDREPPEEAETA